MGINSGISVTCYTSLPANRNIHLNFKLQASGCKSGFAIVTVVWESAVLAFTMGGFLKQQRHVALSRKGVGRLSARLSTGKVTAAPVDIYIRLFCSDVLLYSH